MRINPSIVQYVDGGGRDAPGEVCCGVVLVVNLVVLGVASWVIVVVAMLLIQKNNAQPKLSLATLIAEMEYRSMFMEKESYRTVLICGFLRASRRKSQY